jgi:hypothetical protein
MPWVRGQGCRGERWLVARWGGEAMGGDGGAVGLWHKDEAEISHSPCLAIRGPMIDRHGAETNKREHYCCMAIGGPMIDQQKRTRESVVIAGCQSVHEPFSTMKFVERWQNWRLVELSHFWTFCCKYVMYILCFSNLCHSIYFNPTLHNVFTSPSLHIVFIRFFVL